MRASHARHTAASNTRASIHGPVPRRPSHITGQHRLPTTLLCWARHLHEEQHQSVFENKTNASRGQTRLCALCPL